MKLKITLKAIPEHETPEESDNSTPSYAEAVREQMETADGIWGWCTVQVTVKLGGKKGRAYLGHCSYKSAADFIMSSGYFDGMVADALAEIANQKGHADQPPIPERFTRPRGHLQEFAPIQ